MTATKWTTARVGRAVRRLSTSALLHYRANGLISTGRKSSSWLYRRLKRALAERNLALRPGLDRPEFQVPFDPATLRSVCPSSSNTALIQEMPIGLDTITAVELLATWSGSRQAPYRATFLSAEGEVLARVELTASMKRGYGYVRIEPSAPIVLGERHTIYLLLEARDGVSPAFCVTEPGRGELTEAPSDLVRQSNPLAINGKARLLIGSLVYQVFGHHDPLVQRGTPHYRVPRLNPAVETARDYVAAIYCSHERAERWRHLPGALVVDTTAEAVNALRSGAAQVIVFDTDRNDDGTRRLLQTAWRNGLASAYYLRPETVESDPCVTAALAAGRFEQDPRVGVWDSRQLMLDCDFVLYSDESCRHYAEAYCKRAIHVMDPADRLADTVVRALVRARQPRVSVVSILYNKEDEVPLMLRSLFQQTYAGEIEIIFVDDRSPDRSAEAVERFVADFPKPGDRALPVVSIIRSPLNRGNCTSRNVGIAGASGDLIVVIDADCMVNRDFIRRHVEAHAYGDCEVSIGPLNIETGARDPAQVLAEYEAQPWLALDHAELQDKVNRSSFLNCITRNFCIGRNAIKGELFDPLFSYSADPASGFGWEDVEMGYRLHQQGARIKFVTDAFSIHISPPVADPDASKPARSMRNFRRLFDKHAEFAMTTHRWSTETLARIQEWASTCGVDIGTDVRYVADKLGLPAAPTVRTAPRRLRVLTYRWHVPHQYELYKLPFDFTLVTNLGCPMTDRWEYGQRPFPPNARMIDAANIDPRDFDLAILHFDENVLAPENTNGVIGPEWGAAFRWFLENVRLPSVAVCHGTPQFHGQYNPSYSGADLMQPIEAERVRLVDALAETMVVCNSHQAQAEWCFKKSRTIWHGFDPAEFPPATYERGILSPLGPLVLSRPHYRGYFVYRHVFDGRYDDLRPHSLKVPDPHFSYVGNALAEAKYRLYVNEIRRYSVYFNPTLRSPMPRARAEPMMCGVVPVSARNHDVDRFIRNGINGFYSDDAEELRDQLIFLHKNPAAVRRIGAEARRTARTVFNYDRYLNEWAALASEVAG